MIFVYKGNLYPEYLKHGGGSEWIQPLAKHFCTGLGFDVGCGKWPLPGATPVDLKDGQDALALPEGQVDYVFSSHCVEHLVNPVEALRHWKSRIRSGGVLFLYLPHPEMEYWRPQNCSKHLHQWWPEDMQVLLEDLGFVNVIRSERDLAWSFSVVGFVP